MHGTTSMKVASLSLNVPRASAVCLQIATALQHLHQHGMAHLDVKPDNIYTESHSDSVKLGDFGLATPLNHHNLSLEFSEGDSRCATQLDVHSDAFTSCLAFSTCTCFLHPQQTQNTCMTTTDFERASTRRCLSYGWIAASCQHMHPCRS